MNRFLIGFFIVLIGCNKPELAKNHHVKGIVLHNINRQPISHQTVSLHVFSQEITRTNDPEWPNGKPVAKTNIYYTQSDANGFFSFNIPMPAASWSYKVEVATGDFIQCKDFYRLIPDATLPSLLNGQDTVFVERPAYVQYHINTKGSAFENESLYISTPYKKKRIRPDKEFNGYSNYNWLFLGSIETVLMDTIPGESITNPEVEWLRRRFDTIAYKKERLEVLPMKTTEYRISY